MVTEIGLPLLSVSLLISVTFYVTAEAILILLDKHSNGDVDIVIMYSFATVNFVVDAVCTALFHARGSHIFHSGNDDDTLDGQDLTLPENSEDSIESEQSLDQPVKPPDMRTKNLNMISAFFHIGGDTLRTIAIFVAALVTSITNRNPEYCDAWAAIVVSVTILFLAIPMLITIFQHLASSISNADDMSEFSFLVSSSCLEADFVDSHVEMSTITDRKSINK